MITTKEKTGWQAKKKLQTSGWRPVTVENDNGEVVMCLIKCTDGPEYPKRKNIAAPSYFERGRWREFGSGQSWHRWQVIGWMPMAEAMRRLNRKEG